jgi:transcriptional regulator with XRE-family HTH domain
MTLKPPAGKTKPGATKPKATKTGKLAPIVAGEPPALPTGELPAGKPQVIEINGQRMVIMPEIDYAVLIEAARDNIEDLAAAADATEILRRIESGEEDTLPFDFVRRLGRTDETGENRIKLWREHRALTQAELGARIGSDRLYISQLETGVRKGSTELLQKIAGALSAPIELILPKPTVAERRPDPAEFSKLYGLGEKRARAPSAPRQGKGAKKKA